jgi:hypothetical protein
MNVWNALEALCGQDNPRLVVIIEKDDAAQIMALRYALAEILDGITERKIIHAKQLLGMQIK